MVKIKTAYLDTFSGVLLGALLSFGAMRISEVIKRGNDRMDIAKTVGSCADDATVIRYDRSDKAEYLRIWDNDGIKNHHFRAREFGGEDRVLTFLALQHSSPNTQWRITDLKYAPRESTRAECQRDLEYVLDKAHQRWDISIGINPPYRW